jgi:hypothetical protein
MEIYFVHEALSIEILQPELRVSETRKNIHKPFRGWQSAGDLQFRSRNFIAIFPAFMTQSDFLRAF